MVAPDGMVVGHRAAIFNHGIQAGRLDHRPLLLKVPVPTCRLERKVWRRSVRIDVRAAARYLPVTPGCFLDRLLGRRLHSIMEGLEPFPGNRGLKRIADNCQLNCALARVRHTNEGGTPSASRPLSVRVRSLGWLWLAAMVATAF